MLDLLVAAIPAFLLLMAVEALSYRHMAQDAREESKRALLEAAGRKEVAMLVPLVFLILPVTVLVAIWPGVLVLRMGF